MQPEDCHLLAYVDNVPSFPSRCFESDQTFANKAALSVSRTAGNAY